MEKNIIKTVKDLIDHTLSYILSLEIFVMAKGFPIKEIYSQIQKIKELFRAAAINIRGGLAIRKYENILIRQLVNSIDSSRETKDRFEYLRYCKYISTARCNSIYNRHVKIEVNLNSL